jgi:3-hydroxy-9,10-secoandrosta-1,3,5(10)-triene-9,17-dione monooxygenase
MKSSDTPETAPKVTREQRPGRSELVARAAGLQPLLREHADRMDGARRITDDVNAALIGAGMFRLLTPRRLGGYEAGVRTAVEVIATLGEADGSVAWLVGIGATAAAVLGKVSKAAQDAVFGTDRDARIASSFAPGTARRVEGGVQITGSWANASGSIHATWAMLTAAVLGDDGEVLDAVVAVVPASALSHQDTWLTVGMRGTGSNTWRGEEVFVPEHMMISANQIFDASIPPPTGEAIYRLPLSLAGALTLAAPVLGIGRAAVHLAIDKANGKPLTQTTYQSQSDSVGVQIQLAEAAIKLRTASLHIYTAADEIDKVGDSGAEAAYPLRAQIRAQAGYAAQQVLAAIHIAMNVHGASGFAESSRMQQYLRDANTAARHSTLNATVGYEVYGKALLGNDERIDPLV